MLNSLFLSFVGALFCTLVTSGFDIIDHKNITELDVECAITLFVIDYIYMMLFFYISCKELTFLVVARWIWPALIVNMIILEGFENDEYEKKSTLTLMGLSLIFFISVNFGPVQNLIFKHDMRNIDITYAVTSDEILAKIDLKIDNAINNRNYYSVKSPEMRIVNGKCVAVYHITQLSDFNKLEYIPGYAIQEKGQLPKIVQSRIYFDTSFFNRKDALRTIRRKYKTEIIGDHKFDVDDEGNPYEVFEYREKLYSSNDNEYGLIILNLNNGTSEKYPVSENNIPEWVDFITTYPR